MGALYAYTRVITSAKVRTLGNGHTTSVLASYSSLRHLTSFFISLSTVLRLTSPPLTTVFNVTCGFAHAH